ncbi:MAG: excisionase, partial [Oscillospiraceae bacterium]|nr:excisionase [Oscillospiraceae bacterium]
EYFGFGIKRMRSIAESNEGNFTLKLGGKFLVIRSRVETRFNDKAEELNNIYKKFR